MDLDIDGVRIARERADLALRPGERQLAGGTFLYSEPVPAGVTGLVDLLGLDWTPWTMSDGGPGRGGAGSGGLDVAATCTIATLRDRAAEAAGQYPGLRLVAPCVSAFLLSFKVAHTATVGGNLCLGLPAGPMAALFATLDGTAEIWTPDGARTEPVSDLITGPGITTLTPGEVLRAVHVPPAGLEARTAARKLSLTDFGRSAVLITAAVFGPVAESSGAEGFPPQLPAPPGTAGATVRIVVTASVPRPVVLRIPAGDHDALDRAVDRITDWYDDPHGAPDWRAAMTRRLTHEVLEELS
ncbi:FAD binding domain-containing protein [Myceligenerans pegani]|uniref:FAD binding domain-containing protein n=1 Tax=Myceligenerans pegani TaxID=2776917 RepID=A0ABR9N3P6_9MICO|nr:FAD binding domain-containing protein [Myceligenerans sp. TRM 65318]MBE1877806.1 FAD binding domain-containing protein [Myceligenerans sp. TRM 65318]MBE3020077.1 FAD binding domain-containing protein [Myceligenerans sp. TRM 65318]